MKEIKLISLTLLNFKGVKSSTLPANGENLGIFGDNETGKTTHYDGFLWLLFGKDSFNKTDFGIKTVTEDGEQIHNLEHSVEGVFTVNGSQLELKRVYYEDWVKKRGAIAATFNGHKTNYFIDGVPKQKKEYDDLIRGLIDENVFKLLTNPSFFNEQLKWQERRELLLEICGDIEDADVIEAHEALADLTGILGGRSIDDHKKVIASKRSKINDELKSVSTRVDEVSHNLPDITGLDEKILNDEISSTNKLIEAKQDEISNIRNGNAIAQKDKEIQEVEIKLLKIKQEHDSGSDGETHKLKARTQEEESNVLNLKSRLENGQYLSEEKKKNIQDLDLNIEDLNKQLVSMRAEFEEIEGREFVHNEECICPTCEQELPEEQLEAAKEKALQQFNLKNSTDKESNIAQGKAMAERKKEAEQRKKVQEEEITKYGAELEKLEGQVAGKKDVISKLKELLQKAESEIVNVEDTFAYKNELAVKVTLENEKTALRNEAATQIESVQQEINGLREQLTTPQASLNDISIVRQANSRIIELEDRQKELAEEFEQMEKELFLTEEFTRLKVEMLDEKINSKFKLARFKLFETQINGGLKETCVTTYKGVPYDQGLNNAARINIGLDIISTLSEHYGFNVTIFVDNAEAVVDLLETDAQMISLIVSGKDKQLRVEKHELQEVI